MAPRPGSLASSPGRNVVARLDVIDGSVPSPEDGPPSPTPGAVPAAAQRRFGWILPLLLLATLGGSSAWIVAHWGLVETDNAQLEADLTEISSRVPGTVERVTVQDNQPVRRGDLLVQLDSRDARAQMLQAEADLLAARQEAEALRASADSTLSRADAAGNEALAAEQVASAELQRAQADRVRLRSLVQEGGVSQQDLDRAEATWARAKAAFLSSRAIRQSAAASRTEVGVNRQKAAAAAARVIQAQAALGRARLALSYLRITAPASGRIGARTAEAGRQVQPGQPLMTLVSSAPWVEAHFKETQLDDLYPGQPAEVRIDAFPGRVLRGRIVSLAPASGARFALLPPDNVTGNFTKVVQRITARIALLECIDPALRPRLVPGLSASVSVHRR
ncbi:MAG: HlyD family secretion protein [Cyanobium sp.]